MTSRAPGTGRFAHPEREQRWIMWAAPPDARPLGRITDRYLDGTTLRLRRVEAHPDGPVPGTTPDAGPDPAVTYKLTQKVRPDPADPTVVRLTTMYLRPDEYAVLADLPAAVLEKDRLHLTTAEGTVAVDRFTGRLAGLLLAEAELGPDEPWWPPPPFAGRDVTGDERYTGGHLARASAAEAAVVLRDAGVTGSGG